MCHHCPVAAIITVDIWSDVVCPFCYLGFQQFHTALDDFDHANDVVVRHHAFELNPRAPLEFAGTLDELLATKYSLPLERATELNRRVANSAAELGLEWTLEHARPTNTFDAHRLVALASEQGRGGAMIERLFRAYFSDGLLVSDATTLARLADEIGVEGAASMIRGHNFEDAVRDDEIAAEQLGVTGVPALIFNQRVHVSGAQGTAVMLSALRDAWIQQAV